MILDNRIADKKAEPMIIVLPHGNATTNTARPAAQSEGGGGFGDANGLLPATTIASNGQWTIYFRRMFQVPVPSQVQTLAGRIQRDDAVALYLNGSEIWRDTNFPAGPITNTTSALLPDLPRLSLNVQPSTFTLSWPAEASAFLLHSAPEPHPARDVDTGDQRCRPHQQPMARDAAGGMQRPVVLPPAIAVSTCSSVPDCCAALVSRLPAGYSGAFLK